MIDCPISALNVVCEKNFSVRTFIYQVPENMSGHLDGKITWRKVLYEKQSQYPDHYVPDSFLKDLRKNGKKLKYIFLLHGNIK